ncbi:MAG TPA: DUF1937 family protein [Bacteroidales bacterium]|nr:DUF1937 family protein [Bacteroidales bacterium]
MVKIKSGFYYFTHPYSAQTVEGRVANYELCCRRSAKLLLAGYNIFSPITHSHSIEMACLEMLKWSLEERYEFWLYTIDMAVLEYVGFTGVILALGWGKSKGCKREYEWFILHKQPNGKPHEILQYSKIIGD